MKQTYLISDGVYVLDIVGNRVKVGNKFLTLQEAVDMMVKKGWLVGAIINAKKEEVLLQNEILVLLENIQTEQKKYLFVNCSNVPQKLVHVVEGSRLIGENKYWIANPTPLEKLLKEKEEYVEVGMLEYSHGDKVIIQLVKNSKKKN